MKPNTECHIKNFHLESQRSAYWAPMVCLGLGQEEQAIHSGVQEWHTYNNE